MSEYEITASWFLIGAAIAIAGIVGVFQPPGHRGGVLLALLAGTGVGIGGLALGWSSIQEGGSEMEFWRAFLVSSIAGFVTVAGALAVAWRRARPGQDVHPQG